LQKQLFEQTNKNAYDLEAIYHTFFAEESIFNHDIYTNESETPYVNKPSVLGDNDLVPSSLLITRTIQNTRSLQPFKTLFDPGSDNTFIHERCLPPGATPIVTGTNTGRTLASTFTTTRLAQMENIILPEFHRSRKVDSQEC
jgi:hypothetical protein